MEGDTRVDEIVSTGGISTHALTWRATAAGLYHQLYTLISTHAPHMEGDNQLVKQHVKAGISTHALTWRAT